MRIAILLCGLLLCAVSVQAQDYVCIHTVIPDIKGEPIVIGGTECHVMAKVPFTFTQEDRQDFESLYLTLTTTDTMLSAFQLTPGGIKSKADSTPKEITDVMRFWTKFIDEFRSKDAPRGKLCTRHPDWRIVDYEIDVDKLWVQTTVPKPCKD
jgi:hypothetical protein